jgi:NAD-dependent dihydropyrimidine dehydrogenase PreA subunit
MTYVIGEPCVDIKDRACVDECPVDCIYEGARMLYIHPDECVDCGACEPVCPVEAIYYEDDLPEPLRPYIEENVKFFTDTLQRDRPIPWDHRGRSSVAVPLMPTPRWWRPCRRRATDAHRRDHAHTGDGPAGAPKRHPGDAAGLGRAAQHRQRCR